MMMLSNSERDINSSVYIYNIDLNINPNIINNFETTLTLSKSNTGSNVKFLSFTAENFIEDKTNWTIKIDDIEIDKSNQKEFTTSFDYSDYTLGEHTLEIFLLDENAEELDKKTIILNIQELLLDYSIERIVIVDADSNEFASESVPTNKPLTIIAETNINTIDEITFTWSIDGTIVKEGLGVDNFYLDYTFTKPESTILVSIERGSEGVVSKELKVSTLLNTLEDLRAIGDNRKIVVEDGYFEEAIDGTGNYYTPTGTDLTIYDSQDNSIVSAITLSDTSEVKIYANQIISTDENAYITLGDDKLPLFQGKFKIEDGILRNLLLLESMSQERLDKVADPDKYCEDISDYNAIKKNTIETKCKDLMDSRRISRDLISFLSKNIMPISNATLLVGIDADAIGISPALMAIPYLWDGKLDLGKKEFKVTALASSASIFNLKGEDYSLLTDVSPLSLITVAKGIQRIPFIHTLKQDGSAITEVGKCKLQIKGFTLEFLDSKSLVFKTETIKTVDNDKHRKNTATIKNAKAYLSMSLDERATNIGFEINNAKIEENDGIYELLRTTR